VIDDVLVIGAGPAGAVAATVLARAGARVRLIDRSTFPREKLCGDSLNPGTLALLRRLQLAAAIEPLGSPIEGMLMTGQAGRNIVSITGRYPRGLHGRSISRRVLDDCLLDHAIKAGAGFEAPVVAADAIVVEGRVRGVAAVAGGISRTFMANVTIAADGRRSRVATRLGLLRTAARPRRWAVGAYFEGSGNTGRFGEMHIRAGRYIGVAPVPGGAVNVCLVRPSGAADALFKDPELTLRREVLADPFLRDRFADARIVRPPIVLGPLAMDATGTAFEGLITAGDAAGFIDPMTGDGLRFAMRGGELAAAAALQALEHGWFGVHAALSRERRREFGAKWRFNRALRRLVGSTTAVRAVAEFGRIVPEILEPLVTYAGDCRSADGKRNDESAADAHRSRNLLVHGIRSGSRRTQ
jgi:flavin-dependent dehydrogenase